MARRLAGTFGVPAPPPAHSAGSPSTSQRCKAWGRSTTSCIRSAARRRNPARSIASSRDSDAAARSGRSVPIDRHDGLRRRRRARVLGAGEELDVVTYVAGGPLRGRFVHAAPGAEPRTVDVPNAYVDLSLERRTVLLRLRGWRIRVPDRGWESLVVTEDDHIDYPGPSELEGAIPVTLVARLRRSHFLFLGYDLADWNLRLVVSRLRGRQSAPYASWAVRAAPTALELAFWRHLDVRAVEIDEDAFAGLLDARLDGMVGA